MKRIAVVEDEVYMREELCNMLQRTGILWRQSPSLKMPLGSWQPSVDLVILDLNCRRSVAFKSARS